MESENQLDFLENTSEDYLTDEGNSNFNYSDELCNSLEDEEHKIFELEERRQRLENDMKQLENEIEHEKELFREAIDLEIANRFEKLSPRDEYFSNNNYIDPFSIDTEEVQTRLNDYRKSLEESKFIKLPHENDVDIKRLKINLEIYKKVICNSDESEEIIKKKKKSAAKIFHKHLEQVEAKCNEHIDKIDNIQKNIDHFNFISSDQIVKDIST